MQIEYLADHEHLVPTLARLLHDEFSYIRPGETLEARTARLRSYLGRRQIPTVLVALDRGRLLGSAMLVEKDLDTHPHLTPWLAGVYVLPEHRRYGIATALASHIVEEARGTGVRKLYLYTAREERFYSQRGWSLMERAVFHDAPVAVMSYEIAA